MLENWILEIRKKADTYQSHTWRYQISGNSIELSVLRHYLKDKEAYRAAVIAIGRVLKALSYKIENSKSYFLIQSFPSIENHEVIASIRMDEKKYHESPENSFDSDKTDESFEDELKRYTEYYQLKLEHPEQEFIQNCGFGDDKTKSQNWHLITSKFDNPFTWLNVGYWQETIAHTFAKKHKREPHFIMNFCRIKGDPKNGEATSDEVCPQILFSFG